MATDGDAVVAEQINYYRARASEYDKAYDSADLRELLTVLDDLPITGKTLELACGTGQWTQGLAARAHSVTALDASPEAQEIARTRVSSGNVRFTQADIFSWQPSRRYDTVFFAFWLSHVPPDRFTAFWTMIAAAVAAGGKAIFIDEGPTRKTHDEAATTVRRVEDGRTFSIVKVFYEPTKLADDLKALGWSTKIRPHGNFLVGIAERPVAQPRN